VNDEVELPEPDTSGLAWSGRSVDYINGYEAGYEAAAEKVRAAVLAERERCAKVCEEKGIPNGMYFAEVIRKAQP
jgi:hypothetical protein